MQVNRSVAFLFHEGAPVVSCIMKLIYANSLICTWGYPSPKNASSTRRSVQSTGMAMVFAGELGRQNAPSQQKLWATRQRLIEEIVGWTESSPTSFFKKLACLFQLDCVNKTYVQLFNFLVIFVSDLDYNQDKYLNVSFRFNCRLIECFKCLWNEIFAYFFILKYWSLWSSDS